MTLVARSPAAPRALALALGVALGAAALTGCDDEVPAGTDTPAEPAGPADPVEPADPADPTAPGEPAAPCVSDRTYFAQRIWGPILEPQCIACHSPQGLAKDTKLVLQSASIPGFMDANFEALRNVAAFEFEGESLLLLKPSMQLEHVGGLIVAQGTDRFDDLTEMVRRFDEPTPCEDDGAGGGGFSDIVQLDPVQTFRKATLALAGRLPTDSETSLLMAGGEVSLEQLLRDLTYEPEFSEWLKETYNDLFLTDRYVPDEDALDLLDGDRYPDAYWFDDPDHSAPDVAKDLGDDLTNIAVAQEALELVAYVVERDLPFSEILTADYMVVNPFSARTYGVFDEVAFDDPLDPAEFRAASLPDIPHAGVLTSSMFLNRFPTTETNRNRHRSRMVQQFFLATDVMELAERPIDPTSIEGHNPTKYNPNCTICHETIDPIAGAFQNWTAEGRYDQPEAWYQEMPPAGFGDVSMDFELRSRALQWLAVRMVDDPRFHTAALYTAYTGLTGQTPLRLPKGEDPDYAAKAQAYEAQQAIFAAVVDAYMDAGQSFRELVVGLVRSPVFRAVNTDDELAPEREIELSELGTGRLLTPPQLDRKIAAVSGDSWRDHPGDTPYLLAANQYRIFYGGIDSDTVTRRITAPNGLMVAVQERMANEVACEAVSRDFSKARTERLLFPFIERGYVPEDGFGFVIPGAVDAIEETIRHLHWHVIGERLQPGDAELEATYELFYEVWSEGRQNVSAGAEPSVLPSECRSTKDPVSGSTLPPERQVISDEDYTVRAWMAVLSYLLSDFRFLYD